MLLEKITEEQRGLIMSIAQTIHPSDFIQAVGLAARHMQKAEHDAAESVLRGKREADREVLALVVRSTTWEQLAQECESILGALV